MSSNLNARVANNLRRLRVKQKLSQEDAADKCGLHRTYLGAIERSERNVTLTTLEQLASGLGIDPLALLKPEKDSK